MKAKTLIIVIFFMLSRIATAQFVSTPQEDKTNFGIWIDPVATKKEKTPQIGIEIGKILHWGWIQAGVSFIDLQPYYFDAVGSGGVNLYLFNTEVIRYYAGARLGILKRSKYTYPLVGTIIGFDVNLSQSFAIGLRYYIDYREDQKEQFFGDYETYEPGLITNNPLLQENGAIVIKWTW